MAYQTPSNLSSADEFASEEYIKLRNAILACAFATHPLGGSRSIAIASTGYQDAIDYVEFTMPDSPSSGGVWAAIVDVLCENAATTITPRIYNVTDAAAAVTGSAHASTSWGKQTLTFTPVAGKTYRLQAVKSDDVYACYAIGVVRRTDA